MKSLTEKAMIASLTVSQWGGRKTDRQVTGQINRQMEASDDAGTYTKMLVSREALSDIQHYGRRIKRFHEAQTLIWGRAGEGLLPSKNYWEYTNGMQELKEKYFQAVSDFIAGYPKLVEQAKIRLRGMFNETDYPHISEIRQKFDVAIDIFPIPNPDDFRVNLQEEELEQIRSSIQQKVEADVQKSMQELWGRLYHVVERMATTLADPEKKFQKSMIDQAIDICQVLPRLNLTDDPALEEMRQRVESDLAGFDAQALRESERVRKQTANAAKNIMDSMAGYMGTASQETKAA